MSDVPLPNGIETTSAATPETVAEVAALLRVNQQTVRNWLARGSLAGVRVGPRRIRVRDVDVERFLADAATAAPTPAGRAYVVPSLCRPAASDRSAAIDRQATTRREASDPAVRPVRSRSPRRDALSAESSRPATATREQRGELARALNAVADAVERLWRVLEQAADDDVG